MTIFLIGAWLILGILAMYITITASYSKRYVVYDTKSKGDEDVCKEGIKK